MIILRARQEDLAEILALQKECYLQEAAIYDDYNIPPLLQPMESIEVDFKQAVFLKAIENRKIIGSVRAYKEAQVCKIGRLIVHPDFQNKGLGKKLMKKIEKEFSEVAKYELFTGHRSEKNLKFYQKIGYQEFQRKQVHDNLELVFLEKKQS